jgi:Fe-S-cluster-containing hydrogenase component 2
VNALDAAARLISSGDELPITHFERCLHQFSVEADCDACLQVCPTEAITKGDTLVFKRASCAQCLACVPACPTGVFTKKSQLAALLRCGAYSPTAKIELLCEFHPSPSGGQSGTPAVSVRGCLAGLGAGVYLCLLEAGLSQISLRCEQCSTCSLSALQTVIEKTVNNTLELLDVKDKTSIAIQRQQSESRQGELGPLWNADNPPISRRELFKLTTHSRTLLAIEAVGEQVEKSGKTVCEDRLRFNAGLQRLYTAQRVRPDVALDIFGYATVALSDDCSACAACARICPTGALAFLERDDLFRLTFKPELCIACGLCSKVCFLNAIELESNFTAGQFAENPTAITLLEGQRRKCYRCGGWFNATGDAELCPVCTFRSKNPFSSKLPPGINLSPPGGEMQS